MSTDHTTPASTAPATPAPGLERGPEFAPDEPDFLDFAVLVAQLLMPSYQVPRSAPPPQRTPALPAPIRSESGTARNADSDAAYAAAQWLGRELDAVVTVGQQAHTAGHHAQAITCCEISHVAGVWLHRYEQWEASHLVGIASAQATEDHAALASLRTRLATVLIATGRPGNAVKQLQRAQHAARMAGDPAVQAAAEAGLGDLAHARGDYPNALACWKHARELYEYAGRGAAAPDGVIDMTRRIGLAWRDSGNSDGLAAAKRFLSDAADAAGPTGAGHNPWLHARALADLAAVYTAAGHPDTALGLLARARTGMDAIACAAEVADIELATGDALARRSDNHAARDRYGKAKAIYRGIGATRDLAKPDQRLACLPGPQPSMDPAEVTRLAKAIPHLLSDALTPDGARLTWQIIRAGQWGKALEAAIADLSATNTSITADQHEHLTALMDGLGGPRTELNLLLKPEDPT